MGLGWTPRRRVAALASATAAALAVLTIAVSAHAGPVLALDHRLGAAALALTAHSSTALSFWTAVAILGQPAVPRLAMAAAIGYLTLRRRSAAAVEVAISLVLSTAASPLLKLAVARPRPVWPCPLATASGWAYPSGHTTAAWAFAATTALVCAGPRCRRMRWLMWTVLVAQAVVVSLDRVFLGVHHPSDVVGGLLLGSLCALLGRLAGQVSATAGSCEGSNHRNPET